MVTEPVQNTVVRKTLHVEVPVEKAFQVFTERMGLWWPPSHHVGGTPFRDILIDKKKGGRWYEINMEGTECIWGTVLAYEPPRKVVLSWHLQPDWSYDANLAKASEVALEFVAEGTERTRVEFEHRHLDRHGRGWEKMCQEVGAEGGWPMILKLYVEAAKHC